MAKAYWVVTYRTIKNQEALRRTRSWRAARKAGGRFIVRGNPVTTYETGMNQRVVAIKLDSLKKALASHNSSTYQAA